MYTSLAGNPEVLHFYFTCIVAEAMMLVGRWRQLCHRPCSIGVSPRDRVVKQDV